MRALLVFLCLCPALCAASPDEEVRTVLDRQVADWNRGDIPGFMRGYEQSDATIFIGKSITKGWRQVLERYRQNYATSDRMGHLDFSDIDTHPLGSDYALVIGRFHLTRSAAAGGDAAGIFSLIFHRNSAGEWKIIADHTS